MKRIFGFLAVLCLITATASAEEKYQFLLQGKTMGTTYHITVVAEKKPVSLQEHIDKRLAEINRSMSTYDKTSEISRFNQLTETGEAFWISDDFLAVMTVSETLFKMTDGAWDGTVGPLVNLWGFGSRKRTPRVPEPEEIAELMSEVGFDKIDISQKGWLKKQRPGIYLDLASIAKGYGVDQVAALIEANGISNYLVEIGGEIYASGKRPDGETWRVGINQPKPNAPFNAVYKIAEISDQGFATSGDYRNFFVADGKRYSHVIDPRTGRAVANGVVSTSVIAPNCTLADGLATGLMVMGPEKGLALVNGMEHTECLIITEDAEGNLTDHPSAGFKAQK